MLLGHFSQMPASHPVFEMSHFSLQLHPTLRQCWSAHVPSSWERNQLNQAVLMPGSASQHLSLQPQPGTGNSPTPNSAWELPTKTLSPSSASWSVTSAQLGRVTLC